jgi:DNA invertase Pin-like site-specific DNA recombinase
MTIKSTESFLEIGAAYIRVSTDDQTELSPDAQVRVIQEEAKKDGFFIPTEYIFIEHKGISGRKASNRPEFQKMIATAKSQKPSPFKRLYLWKFSRFARNQEESTFYKGILRKKCGVEIKSVSEPIMEGMFGRLIETIIEWFDEYYSYNLSGEVLRGMTEKALRSGYQATPCLGYQAIGEGKPFVLDPKAVPLVEYIFQSYNQGKDMTYIARNLNKQGHVTRRGNAFGRRTVHGILTNPFYKGEVCWNGIKFTGSHELIPSVASIFDSVQERINAEYHPKQRREASSTAHWLSGLLKCGTCGSSLGFCRSKDQKKRPDFFQCWRYSKGFHPDSCSVSARIAEKAVLDSLKSAIDTQSINYEYVPSADIQNQSEEALIQEALTRLETKERRIKEAYENEVDTLEEYKDNKCRLQAERKSLLTSLERLHQEQPDFSNQIAHKQKLLAEIATIYDFVLDPNVSNEDKGNALRRVLKKIVFDRKTSVFTFFYYVS